MIVHLTFPAKSLRQTQKKAETIPMKSLLLSIIIACSEDDSSRREAINAARTTPSTANQTPIEAPMETQMQTPNTLTISDTCRNAYIDLAAFVASDCSACHEGGRGDLILQASEGDNLSNLLTLGLDKVVDKLSGTNNTHKRFMDKQSAFSDLDLICP
jgi:hypothetical protein